MQTRIRPGTAHRRPWGPVTLCTVLGTRADQGCPTTGRHRRPCSGKGLWERRHACVRVQTAASSLGGWRPWRWGGRLAGPLCGGRERAAEQARSGAISLRKEHLAWVWLRWDVSEPAWLGQGGPCGAASPGRGAQHRTPGAPGETPHRCVCVYTFVCPVQTQVCTN